MGLSSVVRALDRAQQRHAALGFPYAVVKKFGDDQAGNLAALVAYYAFFSLFPLLLVLVTVLGIVLHGNPRLQQDVLNSGLKDFPVIGTQLRHNVHSLSGSGIGLGVGIVGTFLGARGVASAAQNAFNSVWNVPLLERPGFPHNYLRSFGIVLVFGGGVLATTTMQTVADGVHTGHLPLGPGIRIGAVALATVLNVVVFTVGFRLAAAPKVPTRAFVRGAIIAAVAWEILEALGSYVINHSLRHASEVYGTFGLVLGLLSWLYLQAQITLYAVEIDVVRHHRLWPRGLSQPPLTPADERAYTYYVHTVRRRPEQHLEVRYEPPPSGPADLPASGAADHPAPGKLDDGGGAQTGSKEGVS